MAHKFNKKKKDFQHLPRKKANDSKLMVHKNILHCSQNRAF